jgi:hypothetical protein
VPDVPQTFLQRLGISEGVAIACATLTGYLYAFSYETGYLSHYGIPAWFIQLSLVNVLIAFGAVVFVLVVLPYVLMAFPAGPWWALLYQISGLVLPLGFTAFILAMTDWHDWRAVVVGVFLVLFPAIFALVEIARRLIAPIFLYKDAGSWPHRWEFAFRREREAHAKKPDLLGHSILAMNKAGLRQSWLLILWIVFIVGPFAARYLGLGAAYFKMRYAVVAGSHECIAVRRYGDYLVCTDFDRVAKHLLPSFRLLRLGDAEASLVRIEDLGRLSAPSPLASRR